MGQEDIKAKGALMYVMGANEPTRTPLVMPLMLIVNNVIVDLPVPIATSACWPHVLSHHSVHSVFYALSPHGDFSFHQTSLSYQSKSNQKKQSWLLIHEQESSICL